MEEEKTTVSLLPKGLILLALGGYITEGAEENAEAVVTRLAEFMQRQNVAMIVRDGKLDFLPIVQSRKRKKFLGIF